MKKNIVLHIDNLSHTYDGHKNILYNLNIEIARGEIVALVGPSGCGKSTLLRAIVGTHPPTEGSVIVYKGQDKQNPEIVTKPTRDCGIVYQRYSLFPNLTARQNVAIGLMFDETQLNHRILGFLPHYLQKRRKKISWWNLKKIHLDEAAEMLKKVKLGYAMDRYPHQLSGGESQRVAIAQALIMKPSVMLLDEPFGALDEATRESLQMMLLELYAENVKAARENRLPHYTMIIVTHELSEAVLVGDRVLGLSQYWDHLSESDKNATGSATIVYDKKSPVFLPQDVKSQMDFSKQIEEIRNAVFDPNILQNRSDFVQFWNEVNKGKAHGVL